MPEHQVYPADCPADIVFRVRSPKLRLALAKQACRVELKYTREDWRRSDGSIELTQPWEEIGTKVCPEQVSCRVFLRGEGEHVFMLNFIFDLHGELSLGLFFDSDTMAILATQFLQESGIVVGRDVLVIGYDDIYFCSLLKLGLTTVRQPFATLGQCAIRKLFRLLKGYPEKSCVLQPELIIRDSAP